MKAADVSNPTRPLEISRTWSEHIMEEFFRQGVWLLLLSLHANMHTMYSFIILCCMHIHVHVRVYDHNINAAIYITGDSERTMNLPISYMCDRYTISLPKSQSGIALPHFPLPATCLSVIHFLSYSLITPHVHG